MLLSTLSQIDLYLAMQILALENAELGGKLKEDRVMKAKNVELDSSDIEVIL